MISIHICSYAICYMGFIYDWCEERLEIQSIADDILAKFVPAHVNLGWFIKSIHRWSSGVMVM